MGSIDNKDLSRLRKFFDDVTSHVKIWLILQEKTELIDRYCAQLYLKISQ